MLARTHQCQFNLILDVFDMQGATATHVAGQRLLYLCGEVGHQITHA